MNSVKVRNIKIGEGIPKICVPIVGRTCEEIIASARTIFKTPADIVEWRVDWYEDTADLGKVKMAAEAIRREIMDKPLLFTFRTANEGGQKEIDAESYKALNLAAAEQGWGDLVDVEAFFREDLLAYLVEKIKGFGAKVIASNHDFFGTPAQEEITRRLRFMQEAGADIIKIAVMPKQERDVLTLLLATLEMKEKYARQPVITMSMAGLGTISRLSGELFGSAVTFGSAGAVSAPGQIDVRSLKETLELLHRPFCG